MERCVLSFFDDSYQREVKERCFGKSKFEDTLAAYRDHFLKEFRNLAKIKTGCTLCKECFMQSTIQDEYTAFLNDLLADISHKSDYIEFLFNEVIDIYIAAVTRNIGVRPHFGNVNNAT